MFSDKEDYLQDQPYHNVTIIKSGGLLGCILNYFKVSSHKLFQINKFLSARFYAAVVGAIVKKQGINIIHAHSLYYGYLASYVSVDVPIIFTPMGSDVILHAQNNYIYKYMASRAFKKADVVTGDSVLLQQKGFKVGAREESNYVIQNGVDTSIFYPKENSLYKNTILILMTLLFLALGG